MPAPIRPLLGWGHWITDYERYYQYAKALLDELEPLAAAITEEWPAAPGTPLKDGEYSEALWQRVRRRDMLSDSTRIFSAMAVEAFINLYGVIRLGEDNYQQHFERLGLIPKLWQIVLICEHVSLAKDDEIVKTLERIAQRRNSLVHPKAREAESAAHASEIAQSVEIPGYARESVADMQRFFEQFFELVPESLGLHTGLPVRRKR